MNGCKLIFAVIGVWLCVLTVPGSGVSADTGDILPESHPGHSVWENVPRSGIPLGKDPGEFISLAEPLTVDTFGDRDLPGRVDNSEQPHFRGIFSQINGSCSQASAVSYIFTYEIDWVRDIPADIDANRYPSHFTYNFLNNGENWASDPFDGWQIVRECGVPSIEVYGGLAAGGFTRWMTGYDNYYHAMQNRLQSTAFVNTTTESGLETLKQWFDNHGSGEAAGGLALFGANTIDLESDVLPDGTPEAGKYVIRRWGPQGQFLADHLMTFVGYDDSICYDYNGDDRYTNDEDTNGDGRVDLTDWEVGALIIANSWGTGWANNGFIYMPYRLLAMPVGDHGISIYNQVYMAMALPEYLPMITMKITLTHSCRDKLKVTAGVASDPNATSPEFRLQLPIFNYQGGPNYMTGGTEEVDKTIQFGLDVSRLLAQVDSGETAVFFLEITENDSEGADTGSLDAFSLMDCTSGSPVEIPGTGFPVTLNDNDITRAAITAAVQFDSPVITTTSIPGARQYEAYSHELTAAGGTPPYTWHIDAGYTETEGDRTFPAITGEPLTLTPNNDDGFVNVDLEFEFPFFAETHSAITITTDGSIVFGGEFAMIRNNSHLRDHAAITPMGADLQQFPENGGGIFIESGSERAIIRWISGRYNEPDRNLDFAVVLHDSGRVEFCYGENLDAEFNFTAGISDGAGNITFASIIGTPEIHDGYNIVWVVPDYALNPVPGMILMEDGWFQGIPERGEEVWMIPVRITDINGLGDACEIPFMSSNGEPFYRLNLRDRHLSCGDEFALKRSCGNPLTTALPIDEFVILDVYGSYWFWPAWSAEINFQPGTMNPDSCLIDPVLSFQWPDVEGTFTGLRFWGAILDMGTMNLIDYHMLEWSFGN